MAELESLKSFRNALRTCEDQAAYDAIIEAATFERGAMVNSEIINVLDAILFCGLVNNRARIDRLEKRIEELEEALEKQKAVD